MKNLSFYKMVGTGNDFIMIDNRNLEFPDSNVELIEKICDRRLGIGSDGIIMLENSKCQDFKMRIINPDGSEVDMCGNGARCVVYFAKMLGLIDNKCTVETLAGKLEGSIENNIVSLNMGKPKDIQEKKMYIFEGKEYEAYFLNTGVPHVVIFVEDVLSIDVKKFGSFVRYHEDFKPKGSNCNFVQIIGMSDIKVRTYERGVEDETYSCGTGTCAAAITAVAHKDLKWPVTSTTIISDKIKVDSKIDKMNINQDFNLIAKVEVTFKGEFIL